MVASFCLMAALILLLANPAVHAKCDKDHCYDCFDGPCKDLRKKSFEECYKCASVIAGLVSPSNCLDKAKAWCSGASWPTFDSRTDLQHNTAWAKYFLSLYGELPSEYPVALSDFWCFYTDKMSAAGVQPPLSVGTCPTSTDAPEGEHYDENNACECSRTTTHALCQCHAWTAVLNTHGKRIRPAVRCALESQAKRRLFERFDMALAFLGFGCALQRLCFKQHSGGVTSQGSVWR